MAIDYIVAEITPENENEAGQLDTLWKAIVDCAGTNKKLTPIDEYIYKIGTCPLRHQGMTPMNLPRGQPAPYMLGPWAEPVLPAHATFLRLQKSE